MPKRAELSKASDLADDVCRITNAAPSAAQGEFGTRRVPNSASSTVPLPFALRRRVGRELRVQLVKLSTKHCLGRQHRLVLSNQRGRAGTCQSVLDDFVVFRCAEQHADRGALVSLLHVAIEGLDVEAELT